MRKYLSFLILLLININGFGQESRSLLGYSNRLAAAIEDYEKDPRKENKKKMIKLMYLAGGVGINFSYIVGDSKSYGPGLPGANLGINTSFGRPDGKIVIDAGLNFSMQGSRYEQNTYEPGGGNSSSESRVRLNYLNLPVTGKYHNDPDKGFFAEAGLQPGLLISARDKHEGATDDAKDFYNRFDLGVIVGAGYQVNRKLGIGVRIVPGLTNINKNEDSYSKNKDRNLTFSLKAHYRLF